MNYKLETESPCYRLIPKESPFMRFIGVSTDEQIGFLEKPESSQFIPDISLALAECSNRA